MKEYPEEKDTWTQLAELFGESQNDDLTLMAKIRLALRWKAVKNDIKALSRLEQDINYISTAEGLQARLPYVMVSE